MTVSVVILDHPLINHKMAIIRDKNTNTKSFSENVSEVAALITYEVSRDFPVSKREVETPLMACDCEILAKPIFIVPILRAGLGMVSGIHNIIPSAKIGHIGLYRDEKTLEPKIYFKKLPANIKDGIVILVDPMLATGNSAALAASIIKQQGATDIRFVGLVGCPTGVKVLCDAHPDVRIYLAALDEKLDKNGYIVPGLGDCGDRLFGTK